MLFRWADKLSVRSPAVFKDHWKSGELRIDPSPCWNRDGSEVLVPGVADDPGKTWQLFVLRLKAN